MAGVYAAIIPVEERDWVDLEDPDTKYFGRTHGCDCCSRYKELTVNDLKEHIASLKEELDKCENLLLEMGG